MWFENKIDSKTYICINRSVLPFFILYFIWLTFIYDIGLLFQILFINVAVKIYELWPDSKSEIVCTINCVVIFIKEKFYISLFVKQKYKNDVCRPMQQPSLLEHWWSTVRETSAGSFLCLAPPSQKGGCYQILYHWITNIRWGRVKLLLAWK